VGGLLAKASHDLAEPYAAMAQARTAYLCADNTDHDGLRAWLRGLQSLIAYWAGRTRKPPATPNPAASSPHPPATPQRYRCQ
jgi:hypothetical protein